jgi:hypothetical protein
MVAAAVRVVVVDEDEDEGLLSSSVCEREREREKTFSNLSCYEYGVVKATNHMEKKPPLLPKHHSSLRWE